MPHLISVVTHQSYKIPWSSSHPILSGFQIIFASSQESIDIRRLCALLGCFILQTRIQGSSNHTRKRWPRFGHLLTLCSNRYIFYLFIYCVYVCVTVYCETEKQCWKLVAGYLCFRVLLLHGWTVQNISQICISHLICSSIPGSCILLSVWFCRINISI